MTKKEEVKSMIFENNKEERKQRFFAQAAKARDKLNKTSLFEYIDGLRYAYSLSMRYRSVDLKNTVCSNINDANKSNFEKCLKCGILMEWQDTYYFDKEKAESLQQYILENQN